MFRGCSSLTTAPELPATTLAFYCDEYMFYSCSSLTTAPELPAATLAPNCYVHMFNGCTSLTTAPELPATTLKNSVYEYMFMGCTNLKIIRCRAKVKVSSSYNTPTYLWFFKGANSGTFYGYSEYGWTKGYSGIPSGWEFVELTD